MRIAVYPGTFDPVTSGHLDLADRARTHFDRLVVAVLSNADKQPLFNLQERIALLQEATTNWNNVQIDSFDGLLVHYARDIGANVIVRGIRAISDFEYELQMTMMNRKLDASVETVFLMPNETYSYVSSRLVREIATLGGSVGGLVPPNVERALAERFAARRRRG